ncbi:MAG: hypothetical protein PHV95_09980 [Eubacteriales bacterium]|nr:hypothetical protein [Eubacteriales bacterium]
MKSLFNFKLYKEGLRQSLLPGIIFACVMMLGAIFTPLGYRRPFYSSPFDYNQFNYALFTTFTVFAPILVLVTFSFLNKRNTSDFFHSIPHKRQTLFGSFFAAVMTWIVGVIAVSSAVCFALYAITSPNLSLPVASIIIHILSMMAASFLVAVITVTAMTLTGTVFSNVVVSFVLMFLPRALMTMLSNLIIRQAVILPADSLGFFSNYWYNIPVSYPMYIFNSLMHYEHNIPNYNKIQYIIYTAVLGLIYLLIAFILFKKRKSEMAGSSAVSNLLQHIFRVSLAFGFCLIPCTLYFNGTDNLVTILTLYCIALIIYFSYELITTKKLSSIKRTIPALGILILLNAAFIGSVYGVKSYVLNTETKASDIKGIRLNYSKRIYSLPSYEELLVEKILFQDEEFINFTADVLERTQNMVKHKFFSGYNPYKFKIVLKNGITMSRTLWISPDQQTDLRAILLKNDNRVLLQNAFDNVPVGRNKIDNFTISSTNLSQEQYAELYDIYLDETSGFSLDDKLHLLGNYFDTVFWEQRDKDQTKRKYIASLYATGHTMNKNFGSIYTIDENTPETLSKFFFSLNSNNLEDGINRLKEIKSGKKTNYTIFINVYGYDTRANMEYNYSPNYNEISSLKINKLLSLYDDTATPSIDFSKPFMQITIYNNYYDGNPGDRNYLYFFLQGDNIDSFENVLNYLR